MSIFSDVNLPKISNLVQDQFPSDYKDHGKGFIDFITAYYEWLETRDGPIGKSRNLYKQYDIDTADRDFLIHFKEKYMWGLPNELLGNQRLLQKHIVELYNTKGAQSSIRLLFRLLFNSDIDFYIPSYDIFKLSDNTWVKPTYFEVSNIDDFSFFIGKRVVGSTSGASAIVETYERRIVNNRETHLIFVSSVVGNFVVDEILTTDGIEPWRSPKIYSSVVGVDVIGSSAGFSIGDTLESTVGDRKVKTVVTETYDGTGSINFEVVDGGSYYSTDAIINVTQGANTAGFGASASVYSIKDEFNYIYNQDKILPYANVALSANAYGFPALPTGNASSVIQDCLEFSSILVGTIDMLLVNNPGFGYDGAVNVSAIDPYTSTRGLILPDGQIAGMNADITGDPIVGDFLISKAEVVSSGYAMENYRTSSFVSGDGKSMNAFLIKGAVGTDEGYYENTKSFLSDDKYLKDGHYYQDFSYVIRADYTLDKYYDILKNLVHPAGNAVYGDVRILANESQTNDAIYTDIAVKSSEFNVAFTDEGTEFGAHIDHEDTKYKAKAKIEINLEI